MKIQEILNTSTASSLGQKDVLARFRSLPASCRMGVVMGYVGLRCYMFNKLAGQV